VSSDIINYESVVPLLTKEVPELRPLILGHLEDNGETLPHVLFGDVTQFVISKVIENSHEANSVVDRILCFLEAAFESTDVRVRELISVSFLENLVGEPDGLRAMRSRLGPNLTKELQHYDT
jgi:hypothetical protein